MASEKITNILDLIDALSILELSELVEGIQEKYGVSAVVAAAVKAIEDTVNAATTATINGIVITFVNEPVAPPAPETTEPAPETSAPESSSDTGDSFVFFAAIALISVVLLFICGLIAQWNSIVGGILIGIVVIYLVFFGGRALGLLYSNV